jgi:uncharacterized coiled-coil protein SlyX
MNSIDIVPFALIAVGLLALLGLVLSIVFFLSLKNQLRELGFQMTDQADAIEKVNRVLGVLGSYSLESFDKRLAELEARKPVVVPEPTSPAFVGASRRGQVLRLHRNGESTAEIAETLGVSQGEVNLTLKLQDLFSQTVP